MFSVFDTVRKEKLGLGWEMRNGAERSPLISSVSDMLERMGRKRAGFISGFSDMQLQGSPATARYTTLE